MAESNSDFVRQMVLIPKKVFDLLRDYDDPNIKKIIETVHIKQLNNFNLPNSSNQRINIKYTDGGRKEEGSISIRENEEKKVTEEKKDVKDMSIQTEPIFRNMNTQTEPILRNMNTETQTEPIFRDMSTETEVDQNEHFAPSSAVAVQPTNDMDVAIQPANDMDVN